MLEDNPTSNDKSHSRNSRKTNFAIDDNDANVNLVKPENLIFLSLKFNNKDVNALLDSGASYSFINSSLLPDSGVQLCSDAIMSVTGYGDVLKQTKGMVQLNICLFGHTTSHSFHVLAESDLKYEMILGLDFFKSRKVIVDSDQKSIKINNLDKSVILLSFNEQNQISKVRHERIPVFAATTQTLQINTMSLMPINLSHSTDCCDSLCYFEQDTVNSQITSFEGIFEKGDSSEVMIGNSNKKKCTVKKGDLLGYVSNLLTIDVDDNKEYWTIDELKKKVILDNSTLSPDEIKDIYDMLFKVNQTLSMGDKDIGKANVTPHHIELTDYTPIWQRPRSFAEPINREIEKQCEELLLSDIIEHSNSSWASPCVPVRKPDGQLRLCIDYRKLNAVTKTEKFPMPNLNHRLYRIGEA